MPGRIALQWTNPGASDLAQVIVRRGWGVCPASPSDGSAVGGKAVRTTQVDTGAADSTSYCYAVFAVDASGNHSAATLAHNVVNPGDRTAPGPVTDLTATVNSQSQVVLSWRNPKNAGIAFIDVRRGPANACPNGPADGVAVGSSAVRTRQTDASAKPGVSYCYRVYALDAAGNVSGQQLGADATPPPVTPVVHKPAHKPSVAAAASPSSNWLTSTLVRMVALFGALMLLVMVGATVLTRRRLHTSAYVTTHDYGPPRMALTGIPPVTLVIPALLVLGSAGAIAWVVVNL